MNQNTGISKQVDLRGPSISGTVTVPLIELDKMRVDHANAVAVAEELKSKERMVKVMLLSKQSVYDYNNRGNRFYKGEEFVELGVEWRNLDDFREIIRDEEHDKIHEQFLEFTRKIQKLEDTIVAKEKLNGNQASTISKVNELNQELTKERDELLKDNDNLKSINNDHEKEIIHQTSLVDGINERLKLALKDVEYWKAKKSILYRWFGL